MKTLQGKVAVVTGGASGIGRGIANALGEAGTHVVVADLDLEGAEKVAAEVAGLGVRTLAVATDVADLASVEALAARVDEEFGTVDIVCNNAGVTVSGPMEDTTRNDWSWVMSVNIDGVVNGILTFLPRLRAGGGEKHIVNTASGAGLFPAPSLGLYSATKYAVVGMTEALHAEIASDTFGVSVFCPGDVKSNMFRCGRLRPDEFGGPMPQMPYPDKLPEYKGMERIEAGRIVRQGILDNELYIISHPSFVTQTRERFDRVLDAFERAGARGTGAA